MDQNLQMIVGLLNWFSWVNHLQNPKTSSWVMFHFII